MQSEGYAILQDMHPLDVKDMQFVRRPGIHALQVLDDTARHDLPSDRNRKHRSVWRVVYYRHGFGTHGIITYKGYTVPGYSSCAKVIYKTSQKAEMLHGWKIQVVKACSARCYQQSAILCNPGGVLHR